MKRILYIISAAVLTLGMAACAKDELAQENGTGKDYVPQYKTLTAQIQNEDDVRTHLVERADDSRNKYVVWDDNDEIALMDSEKGVAIYKLATGGGTQQGTFNWKSGEAGVAPFSAVSPSTAVAEDGSFVWPEKQYRRADEGMITGAPMLAQVESLDEVMTFCNLGGIIRFTVKKAEAAQVKDVKSIKVIADGANLSGPFTVQTLPGQTKPQAVISDKGSNSIELVCDPAVPITTEGVPFFIAMPAGSYTNLRFEIRSTDKKAVILTARNAIINVGRSSIASLSKTAQNFDWKEDLEWVDLGLPSGTLWASTNLGAQNPTDYGDYYFWGETEPWFTVADNYTITYTEGHSKPTSASNMKMKESTSDLLAGYDAAFSATGGMARVPSKDQWDELKSSTEMTVVENVNGTGIKCLKFTSDNGNFIYLPYAGRYATDKNSGSSIYSPNSYAEYLCRTNAGKSSSNGYFIGYVSGGWSTSQSYKRYIVATPVRAVKSDDLPVNPYVVTTNNNGKKVRFATGNLWCDASSENVADWTWHFEDTQYGGDEGNSSNYYNSSHVSHFYYNEYGKTIGDNGYGAGPSSPYYTVPNYIDYGKVFGSESKWVTPIPDDFDYMLNTRVSGAEVGTVMNARYALVAIDGIKGLMVFPDNFIWDESKLGAVAPTKVNQVNGGWNTQAYTKEQFEIMDAAGIIFLPGHGFRDMTNNSISNSNQSNPSNVIGIYRGGNNSNLQFASWELNPKKATGNGHGYSVRLVTVVDPGN